MDVQLPPSNPFASVRVRPGALSFLFAPGESAESLVERLKNERWRGQIIGPHGTGKSTLLHALIPAIERAGRSVSFFRPPNFAVVGEEKPAPALAPRGPMVFVIDGFEQLSPLARWAWKLRTFWRGQGLLVTAHRNVGLPTLYETHVDETLAQRVVAILLGEEPSLISRADVQTALAAQHGNLRDALFALYDLYERRKP